MNQKFKNSLLSIRDSLSKQYDRLDNLRTSIREHAANLNPIFKDDSIIQDYEDIGDDLEKRLEDLETLISDLSKYDI